MDINRKFLISFALVGILAVCMCKADAPAKEESPLDKLNAKVQEGVQTAQGQIKDYYDKLSPDVRKTLESSYKNIEDGLEQAKKAAQDLYEKSGVNSKIKEAQETVGKTFADAKAKIDEQTKSFTS